MSSATEPQVAAPADEHQEAVIEEVPNAEPAPAEVAAPELPAPSAVKPQISGVILAGVSAGSIAIVGLAIGIAKLLRGGKREAKQPAKPVVLARTPSTRSIQLNPCPFGSPVSATSDLSRKSKEQFAQVGCSASCVPMQAEQLWCILQICLGCPLSCRHPMC